MIRHHARRRQDVVIRRLSRDVDFRAVVAVLLLEPDDGRLRFRSVVVMFMTALFASFSLSFTVRMTSSFSDDILRAGAAAAARRVMGPQGVGDQTNHQMPPSADDDEYRLCAFGTLLAYFAHACTVAGTGWYA